MFKRLAVAGLLAALVPLHAAALDRDDLLALVAMPLAVAAVSEITDVPVNELVDVVTLLNDAAVPPAQFIEVVRYVPVALVVETNDSPDFVQFLRTQSEQGVRGTQLVTVIEDRIHLIGIPDAQLDVVEFRETPVFTPVVRTPAVRTQVVKAHPHGGPPGQLKKLRGVQTGAEIVHEQRRPRVTQTPRVRDDDDDNGRGKSKGKEHGKDHGKDHGDKGKGQGKGKGKG